MSRKLIHHVRDHLVPTEHNDFIPHLLKSKALRVILVVSIVFVGFVQVLRATDYFNIYAEIYPTARLQEINQQRSALGLQALSMSPVLEHAATLKVQDMITQNYVTHTSPDGKSPWYWFDQVGYTFVVAGETISVTDVKDTNTTNSRFTEVGFATAQGEKDGTPVTVAVTLFGTPGYKTEVSEGTVFAAEPPVRIIDESPQSISVESTDPTLRSLPTTATAQQPISWWSKVLLRSDTYIAAVLEFVIVALIFALIGLATRVWQRHHHKHIAHGVLMVVILSSLLFVGQMGVFAQKDVAKPLPYLQY